MQTVNVIEYKADAVISLRAWNEDTEGNEIAGNTFKDIIKECDPDATEAEIKDMLDEGFYEQGDYQLFLVHSS